MALKPCRECGAQVSTEAEVCPHCGVHSPTARNPLAALGPSDSKESKKAGGGCAIAFVLIIGLIILGALFPKNPVETTPCRSDWTKCADNEELVNKYSGWSLAQVNCKSKATEQAQYGNPVWPWFAFGSFYIGKEYVASGIAIAIEPDAQFQNGFGAMVHSRVTCTYDLRAQRVISVDISAR